MLLRRPARAVGRRDDRPIAAGWDGETRGFSIAANRRRAVSVWTASPGGFHGHARDSSTIRRDHRLLRRRGSRGGDAHGARGLAGLCGGPHAGRCRPAREGSTRGAPGAALRRPRSRPGLRDGARRRAERRRRRARRTRLQCRRRGERSDRISRPGRDVDPDRGEPLRQHLLRPGLPAAAATRARSDHQRDLGIRALHDADDEHLPRFEARPRTAFEAAPGRGRPRSAFTSACSIRATSRRA